MRFVLNVNKMSSPVHIFSSMWRVWNVAPHKHVICLNCADHHSQCNYIVMPLKTKINSVLWFHNIAWHVTLYIDKQNINWSNTVACSDRNKCFRNRIKVEFLWHLLFVAKVFYRQNGLLGCICAAVKPPSPLIVLCYMNIKCVAVVRSRRDSIWRTKSGGHLRHWTLIRHHS